MFQIQLSFSKICAMLSCLLSDFIVKYCVPCKVCIATLFFSSFACFYIQYVFFYEVSLLTLVFLTFTVQTQYATKLSLYGLTTFTFSCYENVICLKFILVLVHQKFFTYKICFV